MAYGLMDGLAHAHQNGIRQRDIQSGNLTFLSDGARKIPDFGLSKFMSGSDVSSAGVLLTTAMHMSPEQALVAFSR